MPSVDILSENKNGTIDVFDAKISCFVVTISDFYANAGASLQDFLVITVNVDKPKEQSCSFLNFI